MSVAAETQFKCAEYGCRAISPAFTDGRDAWKWLELHAWHFHRSDTCRYLTRTILTGMATKWS